jgi:hypothetical protein
MGVRWALILIALLVWWAAVLLRLPSKWDTIVQTVLTLALAGMGVEMANNPPQSSKHKCMWRVGFLVVAVSLIIVSLCHDKHEADESERNQTNLMNRITALTNEAAVLTNEVAGLRKDQSETYSKLCTIFSTNAAVDPAVRLSVLGTEQARVAREIDRLEQTHELSTPTGKVELAAIRRERQLELEIQADRTAKALIEKQMAELRAEEDRKETQRKEEAKRRVEVQAGEEKEKLMSARVLPVLDYAIGALSRALEGIAAECGEERLSDFPGGTPTIYASRMINGKRIASGTNSICLGTNTAWNFRISTKVEPWYSRRVARFAVDWPRRFAAVSFASQTTNGTSALMITPVFRTAVFSRSAPPRYYNEPWGNFELECISIKLAVPNGPNIEESPPATNYTGTIDRVIRQFIAAQDQQAPLSRRSHDKAAGVTR